MNITSLDEIEGAPDANSFREYTKGKVVDFHSPPVFPSGNYVWISHVHNVVVEWLIHDSGEGGNVACLVAISHRGQSL